MINLNILGSTGSIGGSTLAVVDRFADYLNVVSLAGGSNQKLLASQIEKYKPKIAAINSGEPEQLLLDVCKKCSCNLLTGENGVEDAASFNEADIVIAAITGAAGLKPTMKALEKGKRVALANKEVMVMAGDLAVSVAIKNEGAILPVDSEHSAIFQCLQGERLDEVESILLFASGGPFFSLPTEKFRKITVEQALNHPRWNMGKRVTIDSATMMNKGLEMIEAKHMFGLDSKQIEVVIHPQSIAHSAVEFIDGNIIALIGKTDMQMPIQYAISYPYRWPTPSMQISMPQVEKLEFFEPDEHKFRAISLARTALVEGNGLESVLNAADEVAVDAFLNGKIGFTSITDVVEMVMEKYSKQPSNTIEEILEIDAWARREAVNAIGAID